MRAALRAGRRGCSVLALFDRILLVVLASERRELDLAFDVLN